MDDFEYLKKRLPIWLQIVLGTIYGIMIFLFLYFLLMALALVVGSH